MDPHEMDAMGYTPLHVACETGREHNVRLLLERAKAQMEGEWKHFTIIILNIFSTVPLYFLCLHLLHIIITAIHQSNYLFHR